MENVQNVTAALNALGVKTCLACGKTGAKSLCMGCKTVYFCGKACQTQAWPGHKKECRRIVRERVKFFDGIAAAFAADEAMTADACRNDIPAGAECYMCLNQSAPGQLRGDLVRGCSCRGPHTGFVHIRCLVANAEARGEYDDEAYLKALGTCTQCRQAFEGPVAVALSRAEWLHFAGRAVTNVFRQNAYNNLGGALANAGRLDEALAFNERFVEMIRRIHGPDEFRSIEAEASLAKTLHRMGGAENLQTAIKIMTRIHAWNMQNLDRDSMSTLGSALALGDALSTANQYAKAGSLLHDTLGRLRRVHGTEHISTLWCHYQLITVRFNTVRRESDIPSIIEEARELRTVVKRVLGPRNRLTSALDYFLEGE